MTAWTVIRWCCVQRQSSFRSYIEQKGDNSTISQRKVTFFRSVTCSNSTVLYSRRLFSQVPTDLEMSLCNTTRTRLGTVKSPLLYHYRKKWTLTRVCSSYSSLFVDISRLCIAKQLHTFCKQQNTRWLMFEEWIYLFDRTLPWFTQWPKCRGYEGDVVDCATLGMKWMEVHFVVPGDRGFPIQGYPRKPSMHISVIILMQNKLSSINS
jgi:hypothetical protein